MRCWNVLAWLVLQEHRLRNANNSGSSGDGGKASGHGENQLMSRS